MLTLDLPLRLHNPQMHYHWGSKQHILNHLFNITCPKNQPQAEVWLGAYHKASSTVNLPNNISMPLHQLIKNEPLKTLGSKTKKALPFLLKIMAVDQPLSLQVHPDKYNAKMMYHRENSNNELHSTKQEHWYQDDQHKPELIYAIHSFEMLCGFRPLKELKHHLHGLETMQIDIPTISWRTMSAEHILKTIFLWFFKVREHEKKNIIQKTIQWLEQEKKMTLLKVITSLQQFYSNDIAILAPLWMNYHSLDPGDAVFIDPGCPHSYLKGVGIEIMACSDNVLRCGLTSKPVNIDSFCQITHFTPQTRTILKPQKKMDDALKIYSGPTDDFVLIFLSVSSQWVRQKGVAHILFCFEGSVVIQSQQKTENLKKGESCFLPACCHAIFHGRGTLVLASENTPCAISTLHAG